MEDYSQFFFSPLRANSAWLGWEPCTAVCTPQAIGWGKAEYCCWHFDPKECKDARVLLTWKDEFIFAHSYSCTYLCECNLLIIKNKIVTKINHYVCLYCVMAIHLFQEKTDQTESKTTDLKSTSWLSLSWFFMKEMFHETYVTLML